MSRDEKLESLKDDANSDEFAQDEFAREDLAGNDEFTPESRSFHEMAFEAEPDEDESAPLEDNQHSCTIIGLANSGKTTLLLAMQQACLQQEDDPYKLDFVPESDTASALVSLAGDFLFHSKTVRATFNTTSYSFRIFVNNLRKKERESFCSLNITDGPGGYLFPGERQVGNALTSARQELLNITRKAGSLVLCVDGSAPDLKTLYDGLPKLMLDLKGRERRLPYRRVLLLVTKIDQIIDNFCQQARLHQKRSAGVLPDNALLNSMCFDPDSPMTAARIARMLHPLEQTRRLLGPVVDMLQAGLDSTATMAVGLCSALGFHCQTGAAFVNSASGGDEDTLAARLRDWRPFGVREAILFLVADETRNPVHAVPKNTSSAKSWNVRVPLYV